MNKLFIYEYIKRIKRDNIIKFAGDQGIQLDDYELDIIYNYIKNDYRRILSNPLDVLEEAKEMLSDSTYQKLLELYDKYKDKISQF